MAESRYTFFFSIIPFYKKKSFGFGKKKGQASNKARLSVPQNIRAKCLGQDIRVNKDVYVVLVSRFSTNCTENSIKTGLFLFFLFLTLCCIISPISGIIDHYCIKEQLKKIRTNQ